MLKVKGTVRPRSLWIAAAAINSAIELDVPADIVITSGNDSTHMQGSKHYTDEALDFRTKNMPPLVLSRWVDNMKRRLGPGYQFVVESDHLHVEYDAG